MDEHEVFVNFCVISGFSFNILRHISVAWMSRDGGVIYCLIGGAMGI
jgi:hypothetical protein